LNQRFGFGAHLFFAFGMKRRVVAGWREHRVEGRRCKWEATLGNALVTAARAENFQLIGV